MGQDQESLGGKYRTPLFLFDTRGASAGPALKSWCPERVGALDGGAGFCPQISGNPPVQWGIGAPGFKEMHQRNHVLSLGLLTKTYPANDNCHPPKGSPMPPVQGGSGFSDEKSPVSRWHPGTRQDEQPEIALMTEIA